MADLPVPGVVFFSGSASSYRYLCEIDPNFGKRYRFVAAFTDVPDAKAIPYIGERGVPVIIFDYKAWCRRYEVARRDLKAREAYFATVLKLVMACRPQPRFLMASGFMLLLTPPLLSHFEGRGLNVHPALLSILDANGKRKYRGLRVVERAMAAGDPTGSSVHIIAREADEGPIVAESDPLVYRSGDDPSDHQDRMKIFCDGPAFKQALEILISSGWPERSWQAP